MTESTAEQLLAAAERDRLAVALARLADTHRAFHRRLRHRKCVTCQRLRDISEEPSVRAAHDRHQNELVAEIDELTAAIPKETVNA